MLEESAKRRILFINYEFPPLGGGAATQSKILAKALVELGHEVAVLTSWHKDLRSYEEVDGYKIYRIKSLRSKRYQCNLLEMASFIILGIFNSAKIIQGFKPQVSLAFFSIPSGAVSYFLKKRFNLPYVISLRGGDVPGFWPERLRVWHFVAMPLTRLIWRNATHIVAVSRDLKNLAEKTAAPLKKIVHYVPNIVESQKSPNTHKTVNERDGYITLLFVGRLSEQKRIDDLLRALKVLKEKKINRWQCFLVGSGPEWQRLERLRRELRLEKEVYFMGWIDREDIFRYYAESDIFVLPSGCEGMSVALLEAMASSLPIVATKISGNNELVINGRNGLLFAVADVEHLANSLQILIENKYLRKTFGERSRFYVQKYYPSAIAVEYIKLLCKV